VITDPNSFKEEIDSFATSFSAVLVDYVIESDKEKALVALADNQTDMVIVVPDVPLETIQKNQQAEFLVYHNEIDPFQIGYINSVARIYVDKSTSILTVRGRTGTRGLCPPANQYGNCDRKDADSPRGYSSGRRKYCKASCRS
jgi:hypothetical protein